MMKRLINRFSILCALLIFAGISEATEVSKEVNWVGPNGSRIREVRVRPQTKTLKAATEPQTQYSANVIDSPPIDGFVPWIVITTTDERLGDGEIDAIPETTYMGSPTPSNPQTDYAIGIFDTGASAHVFGYESAATLGLFNTTYLTDNTTVISGVTGEIDAWVSQPIGVFTGGLNLLDPNQTSHVVNPKLTSTSHLIGESNVSVIVGDNPGSNPDLATAIGSPMSVFFGTNIRNDQIITVEKDGEIYNGPRIEFYNDPAHPSIPDYPIQVPLELRPLGAYWVEYVPYDIEDIMNLDFDPSSPSVIIGNSSQSLFFVSSVDLERGTYSAIDKDRFMLDTGAQISVIGSRIGARLGLDPDEWDFQVDIEGVTGEVTQAPGFYIDSVKIPAMGEWLEFTNVPMVLLDVASPEGGTLDGIIGMNLFTQYNMVLRGGGLFLFDDPSLELQRIVPMTADLAPEVRDGKVDLLDFIVFSEAWQSNNGSANWNADADLVSNDTIDSDDLHAFCEQWLMGVLP